MKSSAWGRYKSLSKKKPTLFENVHGGYEILMLKKAAAACEKTMRRRLKKQGLPQSWARVGLVFEDQYICVLRDAIKLPERFRSSGSSTAAPGAAVEEGTRGGVDDIAGEPRTYIRVIPASGAGDGVAILPIYQDKMVLVRHYRHATRDWHLEIPRGFGDATMEPEENARRELFEELNCHSDQMVGLGYMYPDTGMMSHVVHLYCTNINNYNVEKKDGELISEALEICPEEFIQLFDSGKINDPFTACAFARARSRSIL